MADSPDVLVRRRSSLLVVLGAASTGLTAGYLWRYSAAAHPLDLLIGLVLAAIAGCHAYAWVDSRTPLFVADGTGVRIRLGRDWTGIPWDRVESVEVEARGRLKDGKVAVLTSDADALLSTASRRSRWAAALNRRLYGASLVAPYGLATTESVADLAAAMQRLAKDRGAVVVRRGSEAETLEDNRSAVVAVRDDGDEVAHDGDMALQLERSAPAPTDRGPHRTRRRPVWASRSSSTPTGSTPVVSVPSTARREERTLDVRPAAASFGALALSEPAEASSLPEIEQLRRPPAGESVIPAQPSADDDVVAGNVSLIIDATTDLSARAMQRVRDFHPSSADDSAPVDALPSVSPAAGTVIGAPLAHARETLGLSVDELADRTRIRPSVIESIEQDDFSACGGDFYARGHLRMLARVLGVDAEPLLEAYDANFAVAPVRARDVFEAELSRGSSGIIRGSESGPKWAALVLAVVVVLVIWGAARLFSASGDDTSAGSSAGTGSRGVASPVKASPPPVVPPLTHVEVDVSGGASRVVVRDRSMHVLFSRVLPDGTVRHFAGTGPLRVHASDAGVVSVSVHGKSFGVLGPAGSPGYRVIAPPSAS